MKPTILSLWIQKPKYKTNHNVLNVKPKSWNQPFFLLIQKIEYETNQIVSSNTKNPIMKPTILSLIWKTQKALHTKPRNETDHIVPALSDWATTWALSKLVVNIEAASPYVELLALSTTSSTVLNFSICCTGPNICD